MYNLFFQSIIIGLAIAAPIGPIGVICIRTTVSHGPVVGFAVGMGAALADAMYALAAGFGLAAIINFLSSLTTILKYGGGIFLLYLGVAFILKKPRYPKEDVKISKRIGRTFTSTFFLTLSNPVTLFSFLGIMSALNVEATNKMEVVTLILGVLIGSSLWWIFLVSLVSLSAKRLSERFLVYINKVSGVILIVFAVYILIWG